MQSKKWFRAIVGVFLFLGLPGMAVSLLQAQSAPVITQLSVPGTVKEMGIVFATVSASDPDGDPITYTWSFESDPTGQGHFFESHTAAFTKTLSGTSKTLVLFGVGNPGPGPEGPTQVQGQQLTVRVTASDGTHTTAATAVTTVSGFNQKPVIQLDTAGMGTSSQPQVSPGAVSLTAGTSYDPDGGPVTFAWQLGGIVGGSVCPGGVLVLFGKESPNPSLPIPQVSARPNTPMLVTFVYRVIDEMYQLTGTATGWAASPNGCESSGGGDDGSEEENPPPQVSVSANNTQPVGGDLVILSASIVDTDTHSQSWMQLDNTTPVALSSTTDLNTAFVAPDSHALLKFRFTATDSVGQSGSADIAILVSPNPSSGGDGGDTGDGGGTGGGGDTGGDGGDTGDGGGTGGGGDTGGDGGDTGDGDDGGDEGTGAGSSSGSTSGCQGLNLPAVASVPASYTITEGLHGQISAIDASDPDNTPGIPINGQAVPPGVNFQWTVKNGQGLLSDSSLHNRNSATVGFTAPLVDADVTLGLELFASDATGCGTRYPIALIVQEEVVNNNPVLVLSYEVAGQDISGQVPAGDITVTSPASIHLDASGSHDADGDPITVSWEENPDGLLSGSTVFSPQDDLATLTVLEGTEGSVQVTATVSDNRGGQESRSLVFVFVHPKDPAPLAVALALQDGVPVAGPLRNGDELSLDAGESTLPEGTPDELDNLVFAWSQIAGPSVFMKDATEEIARVRITDISEAQTLVFRLQVRNGSASDVDEVQVEVEPGEDSDDPGEGEIFYPIVGVGSLGDGSELQTSLILDNLLDEDVQDVQILFFDILGHPMEVAYVDLTDSENPVKTWEADQPFTLAARASRVIEFVSPGGTAPQGEADVRSGWAHVISSGNLQGSIRYQLLDTSDSSLIEDVGIPTSPPGRDFQTAFRPKDEFAFAIANPGDATTLVELSVYDRLDPAAPVASEQIQLEPGQMKAMFLDEILVGLDIEEGHLWIRSDGGDIILSGLITHNGLFVSAQSISRVE